MKKTDTRMKEFVGFKVEASGAFSSCGILSLAFNPRQGDLIEHRVDDGDRLFRVLAVCYPSNPATEKARGSVYVVDEGAFNNVVADVVSRRI